MRSIIKIQWEPKEDLSKLMLN